MFRRLVSAIAAVLGLVVIGLAVCSATVWRPSETVHATLATAPAQNYVLVEPGVLGLVDSRVSIKATAEGEPVALVVTSSSDARAWLADDPYVSVTGLADWQTLASTEVTERCGDSGCTPLTPTNADPTSAELWRKPVTGEGSVSIDGLDISDNDLVLLAATDGRGPAPQIELTWTRKVSTPWLIPGLAAGGLLVLLGVFGLLMDLQIRRAEAERRRRAAERASRAASADFVETEGIPAVGDDPDRPLTRRELREKERAEAAGEEWIDPRTGALYVAGVQAPAVPESHDPPFGAAAVAEPGAPRPGTELPQPAAWGEGTSAWDSTTQSWDAASLSPDVDAGSADGDEQTTVMDPFLPTPAGTDEPANWDDGAQGGQVWNGGPQQQWGALEPASPEPPVPAAPVPAPPEAPTPEEPRAEGPWDVVPQAPPMPAAPDRGRGSVIVPGLPGEASQAHRSARELDSDEALSFTPDENAPSPAGGPDWSQLSWKPLNADAGNDDDEETTR